MRPARHVLVVAIARFGDVDVAARERRAVGIEHARGPRRTAIEHDVARRAAVIDLDRARGVPRVLDRELELFRQRERAVGGARGPGLEQLLATGCCCGRGAREVHARARDRQLFGCDDPAAPRRARIAWIASASFFGGSVSSGWNGASTSSLLAAHWPPSTGGAAIVSFAPLTHSRPCASAVLM